MVEVGGKGGERRGSGAKVGEGEESYVIPTLLRFSRLFTLKRESADWGQ